MDVNQFDIGSCKLTINDSLLFSGKCNRFSLFHWNNHFFDISVHIHLELGVHRLFVTNHYVVELEHIVVFVPKCAVNCTKVGNQTISVHCNSKSAVSWVGICSNIIFI